MKSPKSSKTPEVATELQGHWPLGSQLQEAQLRKSSNDDQKPAPKVPKFAWEQKPPKMRRLSVSFFKPKPVKEVSAIVGCVGTRRCFVGLNAATLVLSVAIVALLARGNSPTANGSWRILHAQAALLAVMLAEGIARALMHNSGWPVHVKMLNSFLWDLILWMMIAALIGLVVLAWFLYRTNAVLQRHRIFVALLCMMQMGRALLELTFIWCGCVVVLDDEVEMQLELTLSSAIASSTDVRDYGACAVQLRTNASQEDDFMTMLKPLTPGRIEQCQEFCSKVVAGPQQTQVRQFDEYSPPIRSASPGKGSPPSIEL